MQILEILEKYSNVWLTILETFYFQIFLNLIFWEIYRHFIILSFKFV
jgi:hypothetical protein